MTTATATKTERSRTDRAVGLGAAGAEYPPETPGNDGTGLTQAVCPKHGKERTVSADALAVKGAPLGTFGLKCLEPLDKAVAKAKAESGARSPHGMLDVSANGTQYMGGAPYDPTLCQEALVPVESYDDAGRQVRKGGKVVVDKDRQAEPRTGGEKLARANDKKTVSKAKNTAKKSTKKKADSRGGKGVSVAEDEA